MMRTNQPCINGAAYVGKPTNAHLESLLKICLITALFTLTSCSQKEKIESETEKIEIGKMSLKMDSLSGESQYQVDTNGVYQLVSKKFEIQYQGWLRDVKVIDKVSIDEELPDQSAGEYTSFSLQWNDNGSVSIRQFSKINMDEMVPGADPWIWDKTYELEPVEGTREDFDAGRTISLQYTEESFNQAKQDAIAKIKDTYGELMAQIIRQASLDKGLDDSSIETETEVVSFSMLYTPMEVSKIRCIEKNKNSESVEIRTILYMVD